MIVSGNRVIRACSKASERIRTSTTGRQEKPSRFRVFVSSSFVAHPLEALSASQERTHRCKRNSDSPSVSTSFHCTRNRFIAVLIFRTDGDASLTTFSPIQWLSMALAKRPNADASIRFVCVFACFFFVSFCLNALISIHATTASIRLPYVYISINQITGERSC